MVTHSNLGASEAGAGIETNTVATCATVDFNFTSIRLESSCSIFGGDTALNSETALGDSILGETELWQSGTSCDLDLSSNNVDASDFLCSKFGSVDHR